MFFSFSYSPFVLISIITSYVYGEITNDSGGGKGQEEFETNDDSPLFGL
jgi:hypothetical protein